MSAHGQDGGGGGALTEGGLPRHAPSPAASSSGEGTDTGASPRRQRTIRPRTDDDASTISVLQFSGSDDTAELDIGQPNCVTVHILYAPLLRTDKF